MRERGRILELWVFGRLTVSVFECVGLRYFRIRFLEITMCYGVRFGAMACACLGSLIMLSG